MISTKQKYRKVVKYEYSKYFTSKKDYLKNFFLNNSNYVIWNYQKILRKTELYYNISRKNRIYFPIYIYYKRKKERLGNKLGLSIEINVFEEGLVIYHYGNIVVNGYCKIGKDCKLHGGNCIGNNGKTKESPIIGDSCDVGFGAIIIGGICLGDNVVIGANSLVNKSYGDNLVIAGSPASIKRVNKIN